MISLKKFKNLIWFCKAKIKPIRLSKESRLLKKQEKIKNKVCTKLRKIMTNKKVVSLLLQPTLLSQRKRQTKIRAKIETRTELFLKLPIITITKNVIMSRIVLKQKTSCRLDNLYIVDCQHGGYYQNNSIACTLYQVSNPILV